MNPIKISLLLLLSAVFIASSGQYANAGIIASATRVIFVEGDNEKSLMLVNTNAYPVIVQTWVDDGDIKSTPDSTVAPFVSLPGVFKMHSGAMKGLRIVRNNLSLPDDRESVVWLNLYEIPPGKPTIPPYQTQVTLAMNTQMKIFYRPRSIAKKAGLAVNQLSFTVRKNGSTVSLTGKNDSLFHISFAKISLLVNGKKYEIKQESNMMIAPLSQKTFEVDGAVESFNENATVETSIIDDEGHQFSRTYSTESQRE